MPHFLVEDLVDKFKIGVSGCRSVDCVLVRLSSTVLAIKDFVNGFPTSYSEYDLFYDFLYHPEVMKVLAGMYKYREVVKNKLLSDPRFKNLRPYISVIMDSIGDAYARYTPKYVYGAVERQALWKIEYEEIHESQNVPVYVYYKDQHLGQDTGSAQQVGLEKEVRPSRRRLVLGGIVLAFMALIILYSLGNPYIPSIINSTSTLFSGFTQQPSNELEEVLLSINSSVLETVGKIVFLGDVPRDRADIVWRVLEWVEKYIEYDEYKYLTSFSLSSMDSRSIRTPLEVIRDGKAVCIDYAVFVSTALLYANISSYIVVLFDHHHAVTVVEVNGKPFVLDQVLPPIEFSDYVEYLLGGSIGEVMVYKVGFDYVRDSVVYTRYENIPFNNIDYYPVDELPSGISSEVLKEIVEKVPSLQVRPGYIGPIVKYQISSPRLYLSGLGSSGTGVILFKLYSPVFHRQWVDYLAKLVIDAVGSEIFYDYKYIVLLKIENDKIYLFLGY